MFDNHGVLLENLVFLHLRKQYRHIFYYRTQNSLEVDFLVYNDPKEVLLIQVTFSLSDPRSRERELKALITALNELNLSNGLILTVSETENIKRDGKEIHVQPIYAWLLQNSWYTLRH